MRKAVITLLAGTMVVIAMSPPAFALKDPFEPLVDPDAQTESTTTTDGTTTVDEPAVSTNGNPFSEGMPETGANTSSWLVLAYLFVVTGAALLTLAWARRPTPAQRQVFRS